MKIRKGFVSNSSSSSFILAGPVVDGKVQLALKTKLTTNLDEIGDTYGEDSQTYKDAKKALAKGLGLVEVYLEYGAEDFLDLVDRKVNKVISAE